jgi:hypothetical protein
MLRIPTEIKFHYFCAFYKKIGENCHKHSSVETVVKGVDEKSSELIKAKKYAVFSNLS